jgi:hypothetical protein
MAILTTSVRTVVTLVAWRGLQMVAEFAEQGVEPVFPVGVLPVSARASWESISMPTNKAILAKLINVFFILLS